MLLVSRSRAESFLSIVGTVCDASIAAPLMICLVAGGQPSPGGWGWFISHRVSALGFDERESRSMLCLACPGYVRHGCGRRASGGGANPSPRVHRKSSNPGTKLGSRLLSVFAPVV